MGVRARRRCRVLKIWTPDTEVSFAGTRKTWHGRGKRKSCQKMGMCQESQLKGRDCSCLYSCPSGMIVGFGKALGLRYPDSPHRRSKMVQLQCQSLAAFLYPMDSSSPSSLVIRNHPGRRVDTAVQLLPEAAEAVRASRTSSTAKLRLSTTCLSYPPLRTPHSLRHTEGRVRSQPTCLRERRYQILQRAKRRSLHQIVMRPSIPASRTSPRDSASAGRLDREPLTPSTDSPQQQGILWHLNRPLWPCIARLLGSCAALTSTT